MQQRLVSADFVNLLTEEINDLFLENAYLRLQDKQVEIDCLKRQILNLYERQELLMGTIDYLSGELQAEAARVPSN